MKQDDYAFLDEIAKEHRAMREDISDPTPEEWERIRRTYPMDTAEAYRHIRPEEFFDGAL